MVRDSTLFEAQQAKRREIEITKLQYHQETQEKILNEEMESRKSQLLQNYHDEKSSAVRQLLIANDYLAKDIIESLEKNMGAAKPSFLAQMAWDNFNELRIEGSSQTQLIHVLENGSFSFNIYVNDWFENKFQDKFRQIKATYQTQADELGIKLE